MEKNYVVSEAAAEQFRDIKIRVSTKEGKDDDGVEKSAEKLDRLQIAKQEASLTEEGKMTARTAAMGTRMTTDVEARKEGSIKRIQALFRGR